MIPFKTTEFQRGLLNLITDDMYYAEIDPDLVLKARKLAETDQGIFDLMHLWSKTNCELTEIVEDLQKSVDDYAKI